MGIEAGWQSRLPEADRIALAESHAQTADSDTPTVEPVEVASPTAHSSTPSVPSSPQEAVQEIWDMPPPSYSGLTAIPEVVREDYYNELVESHNAHRADLAEEAIDQFEPTLDDFSGLPSGIANLEFDTALADYRNDPFVQELGRIHEEATANPDALPSNPTAPEPSAVNVADMPIAQQSEMLAALGIELPENPTPEQLAGGIELLQALPESVIGTLFAPGFEVSFTGQPVNASTPPGLPVSGSVAVTAQGTFELSEVRTGVGFNETQTVKVEAEVRGELEVGVGNNRTTLQRAYRAYERLAGLGLLSDSAMNLVNQSPLARTVLRGTSLPVSFSTQSYAGSRVTYEAVVTPEQGAQISDGQLALPNPFNPLSMENGTGVLLRGEALVGTSFEASYKYFTTNGSVTQLEGLAFGVNRLEGDVVQVVAGPTELVENDFFVGLGKGSISVGLGSDRSLDDQQLTFAEIDLSTESGQQAYRTFLTTGQVPTAGGEGVVQSGTQHVLTYDHTSRAELNLGPLNIGGELNNTNSQWVVTEYDDGTMGYQTVKRINDRTVQVDYVVDAEGDVIPEHTNYTFVYADNGAALSSYANSAFSGEGHEGYTGNQHIQLTFTNAELDELRGLALAQVQDNHPNHSAEGLQFVLDNPSGFTQTLAATETADEAARLMLNYINGYESDLLALSYGQDTALPGTFEARPSD